MTFKSKLSYINIFRALLKLIKNNNFEFKKDKIVFICEFERDLRESIKEIFPNSIIKGNYFQYLKKLWKKAKKCCLCLKDRMKYTKPIMMALLLIVFIKEGKRHLFFNDIIEYIKNTPDEYKSSYEKFIEFYKEKFLNSKFIKFEEIGSDKEWFYKTNNICEIFHGSLSNSIEYLFPKMSLLINKIQEIILSYQKQFELETNKEENKDLNENEKVFINKEDNANNEDDYFDDDNYDDEMVNFETFNTFDDAYQFIVDFHLEKKDICFNSLLKLDNNFKLKRDNIIINNLKYIFGLKCISDVENKKNLDDNVYNFDEIEQVLVENNKIKNIKKNNENDNEDENNIVDYTNYISKEEKKKNNDFIDIDSEHQVNKNFGDVKFKNIILNIN